MANAILIVTSLLAVLLNVLPCLFALQHNIASFFCLTFWIILLNLITTINAIAWGNTTQDARAWCLIASKLKLAGLIALPVSLLCLSRVLARMFSRDLASQLKPVTRGANIITYVVCFLAPLVCIGTSFIFAPVLYALNPGTGPEPAFFLSTPTYLLFFIWQESLAFSLLFIVGFLLFKFLKVKRTGVMKDYVAFVPSYFSAWMSESLLWRWLALLTTCGLFNCFLTAISIGSLPTRSGGFVTWSPSILSHSTSRVWVFEATSLTVFQWMYPVQGIIVAILAIPESFTVLQQLLGKRNSKSQITRREEFLNRFFNPKSQANPAGTSVRVASTLPEMDKLSVEVKKYSSEQKVLPRTPSIAGSPIGSNTDFHRPTSAFHLAKPQRSHLPPYRTRSISDASSQRDELVSLSPYEMHNLQQAKSSHTTRVSESGYLSGHRESSGYLNTNFGRTSTPSQITLSGIPNSLTIKTSSVAPSAKTPRSESGRTFQSDDSLRPGTYCETETGYSFSRSVASTRARKVSMDHPSTIQEASEDATETLADLQSLTGRTQSKRGSMVPSKIASSSSNTSRSRSIFSRRSAKLASAFPNPPRLLGFRRMRLDADNSSISASSHGRRSSINSRRKSVMNRNFAPLAVNPW